MLLHRAWPVAITAAKHPPLLNLLHAAPSTLLLLLPRHTKQHCCCCCCCQLTPPLSAWLPYKLLRHMLRRAAAS
jgi:hypothetical protein